MNRKILLRELDGGKRLVSGQGLWKWGQELGGVRGLGACGVGVGALWSSPEKIEDSLGRGQDVEGHRQGQALSEVGQVELGASKLPLHVGVILGAGR